MEDKLTSTRVAKERANSDEKIEMTSWSLSADVYHPLFKTLECKETGLTIKKQSFLYSGKLLVGNTSAAGGVETVTLSGDAFRGQSCREPCRSVR